MARPKTACDSCASIKSACSKSHPCVRCDRLSLPCSYGGNSPRRQPFRNSPSAIIKRVQHKKSSKGCKSCVSRRKKCDEVSPVCGECLRLGLVCSPRSPKSGQQAHTPPIDESKKTDQNTRAFQDENSPHASHGVSTPPSSDSAPITDEYLAWVALLDENDDDNITRLGHLNNSSALANARTPNRSPPPVHVDTALRNFPGLDNGIVSQWHPTEQHLLNHFLQIVSRALVVVEDNANPLLLEILPMALTNAAVRHSLLALTAKQLCRVYPVFEDTLVHQQSLALHHLHRELLETENSEEALAATLLMCLFEIFHGSSRKWIFHLYGAKALIDSRHSHATSKFLIDLYQHIYCMASLNSDKIVLLGAESEPPTLTSCRYLTIHPILGMAEDLYRCLKSINHLANERSKRTNCADDDAHFTQQTEAIMTYLQAWTPGEFAVNISAHREAVYVAQAIRWGCIIWLYHVIYGYLVPSDMRQEALGEILSAVSCIRPGSPYETQLLFPLVMAGISATLKSERLRIEYRLNILEGITGMGNVARAHQMLDVVWKQMNEGSEIIEWEAMLRNEYGGVVLI